MALISEPTGTDPKADPFGKITCGECWAPAIKHPIQYFKPGPFGPELETICNRKSHDIINNPRDDEWIIDYDCTNPSAGLQEADLSDSYLVNNEGNEHLYPEDYEGHDRIWESIDRYRDIHPVEFRKDKYTNPTTDEVTYTYTIISGEYTSALGWFTPNAEGTYAPTSSQAIGNLPHAKYLDALQSKTVYFPGLSEVDGGSYATIQGYDPELTRAYHHRLLNYYIDRTTGSLRLGGLELSRNGDTFTARCVRNNCQATMSINTETATREQAEAFTYDLIRHGNNHAAKFITSRPDFYKVHTDFCDLTCNPTEAHCGTLEAATQRRMDLLLTELGAHFSHNYSTNVA